MFSLLAPAPWPAPWPQSLLLPRTSLLLCAETLACWDLHGQQTQQRSNVPTALGTLRPASARELLDRLAFSPGGHSSTRDPLASRAGRQRSSQRCGRCCHARGWKFRHPPSATGSRPGCHTRRGGRSHARPRPSPSPPAVSHRLPATPWSADCAEPRHKAVRRRPQVPPLLPQLRASASRLAPQHV